MTASVGRGFLVVTKRAGDASVPKLAVGETPNLAARLQGLARGDEIVIGPSTQRLVGAAFDYEDLGTHDLKGIVEPVRAWRVLSLGKAEGRFEASHASGLTRWWGVRKRSRFYCAAGSRPQRARVKWCY